MKILKSIVLGLALIIACTAAKADGKPTKAEVINIFMNASAHGKIEGLENVLDNDLEYQIKRGNKITIANKKQFLDSYKANQNIEQACICTSNTIENGDNVIVKIDMKYDTYTRTNVVTMVNTNNGWKITKVNTSVANNA
ncbi:hypothetical protein GCM10027049_05020 [Mucilaginibacter puniceus]